MGTHVESEGSDPAGPTRLASRRSGRGDTTVALVHGFAQTGECLGPLRGALEADHRVVRVDQPGHGGSARHRSASLELGAELLVTTTGPAVLIGYSMGARLSLHAALAHPSAVQALVLIGGTAGIEDDAERDERRRADAALADRIEAIGLDAFLEEWLALPMFAGLPRWARFDDERRRNTVAGLAASLRRAGTGSMDPLWERLGEIRCPVLCITGSADERYDALARRMVGAFGGPARHAVVPGVGHAAHLEDPDTTIALVRRFLVDRE